MDDEGEAEDEKGGVLIAMSPKKGGEMNSDRELKQANSRIRELSGSPVSRSEAESNYKKLVGPMSRKVTGGQMTRREREMDRDAAEARPWKLPRQQNVNVRLSEEGFCGTLFKAALVNILASECVNSEGRYLGKG